MSAERYTHTRDIMLNGYQKNKISEPKVLASGITLGNKIRK